MPRHVLITGGAGFLGVAVAELLLAREAGIRLTLTDLVEHPRLATIRARVRFIPGDVGDAAVCAGLVDASVHTVFHFASLVSGGAERDFDAGMRANLDSTRHLLDAARRAGNAPRFVFPSSIATFGGGALPTTVDDWTHQHPQNSYGVAKVVCEQLINEYSRRGWVDGRVLRLPAVIVRDEPNSAVSGYASGLIREPLAGRDYVCPVSPETRIPLISTATTVGVLVGAGDLAPGALGDFRALNAPGIQPSAQDIADAVRATRAPGLGSISFAPDPAIERIVAAWPKQLKAERAQALGLPADRSIGEVIAEYRRESGGDERAGTELTDG